MGRARNTLEVIRLFGGELVKEHNVDDILKLSQLMPRCEHRRSVK